jgi:hypothetical protein
MFNTILASLFDRLKTANPTIALVLGCLLICAYYTLSYLSQNTELPPAFSTVIPYLQGLLVALGLGLNAQTKPYRNGTGTNRYAVMVGFMVLFGSNVQAQIKLIPSFHEKHGYYVQATDNTGKFLGKSSRLKTRAQAVTVAGLVRAGIIGNNLQIEDLTPNSLVRKLVKITFTCQDTVKWSFRILNTTATQITPSQVLQRHGHNGVVTVSAFANTEPFIIKEIIANNKKAEGLTSRVTRFKQDVTDLQKKANASLVKLNTSATAKYGPNWNQTVNLDCLGTNNFDYSGSYWDCYAASACYVSNQITTNLTPSGTAKYGPSWSDTVFSDCQGTTDNVDDFWDCVGASDCFVINTDGVKAYWSLYLPVSGVDNLPATFTQTDMLHPLESIKKMLENDPDATYLSSYGGAINSLALSQAFGQNKIVVKWNGLYIPVKRENGVVTYPTIPDLQSFNLKTVGL